MLPSLIYDLISADSQIQTLGVASNAILESQTVDTRPNGLDYFVTVRFEENIPGPAQILGPRIMTIAVHHPWDKGRDYTPITAILNRIDQLLLPIDQGIGSDGVRVAHVRRRLRSGNMTDEAWKTITRWSTYGVSYDEFAA